MMLLEISIHASREGSDLVLLATIAIATISIHASREGSDKIWNPSSADAPIFQSTLPVREATSSAALLRRSSGISIHASRKGSDSGLPASLSADAYFNPRFPQGKRPAS